MTKKGVIRVICYLFLFGVLLKGSPLRLLDQQTLEGFPFKGKADMGSEKFVPEEVLVEFIPEATKVQINETALSKGMKILEMIPETGIYRLKVSGPVLENVARLQSQPMVEQARPNYILARVSDEFVTLSDMERALEEIPLFFRQNFTANAAKEQLLKALIDYKLFSREAREEGFDKEPYVKHMLQAAAEKTLTEAYLEKIKRSVSLSEQDLKNYYENHKQEFGVPEQIHVRQILVKTEAEAEEILAMINGGTDFSALARERSIDESAQRGGNMGGFSRGKHEPEFDEAAFALEPGEVSEVVTSNIGYHIIKAENKKKAVKQSFEEVRPRIKTLLMDRKTKELTEKMRKEVEAKYPVVIQTNYLSDVKIRTKGDVKQRDLLQTLKSLFEKPY